MRGSIIKLKKSADEKGFSLVELMFAMTIVLVVLGILASILAGINYQLKTQRSRLETVSNAQAAADTVVRLIRMSGNRPNGCVSTFLVSAPTASNPLANQYFGTLRVQADWNPADCSLNGIEEDVTFSVKNGAVYLDAAQAVPFVDKVSALRFKLYDKYNAVITNASMANDIRFVRVEIDTLASDGTMVTITSGASIRN